MAQVRLKQEEASGDEIRSPNGRLACLSGVYWLGMFCDGGRDREPKVYAGFAVTQDRYGNIVSVRKVCEYGKKSAEYGQIRRHYYGKATSSTPWQTYQVSTVVEGRNCQLFTL